MSDPLLTVGIPTYNSSKYVAECIRSVQNQAFQDYEMLVVDNDSSDDTLEIVNAFQDKRIRVLKNEVNKGPHYSINRIHQESKGRLIRCVCSDDVLLPGALEEQVKLFERIPQLALVSSDFLVTDQNLNVLRCVECLTGVLSLEEVKRKCFSSLTNRLGGPSNFMYPAAAAKQISLRPNIKYLGDLDYALQLLQFGMYASTGAPNVLYRRHEETDTGRVWSPETETRDWLELLSIHGGLDHLIAIKLCFRPKAKIESQFMKTWWWENWRPVSKLSMGILQFLAHHFYKLVPTR